jgi:hypothetical protein
LSSAKLTYLLAGFLEEEIISSIISLRILETSDQLAKNINYPRNLRIAVLFRRCKARPQGHYPAERIMQVLRLIYEVKTELTRLPDEQKDAHIMILVKAVVTRRRVAAWEPDHAAGLREFDDWAAQKTHLEQDVLVAACWLGLVDVISAMLERPNIRGPLPLTIFGSALEAAARKDHISLGRALLAHSHPTERTLRPTVSQIGWRGCSEFLDLLLCSEFHVHWNQAVVEEFMRSICFYGHIDMLERFLTSAPKHVLAKVRRHESVAELNSANEDKIQDFVLYRAVMGGETDLARRAIDKGADRNVFGNRFPLVVAAEKGHANVVKVLLSYKVKRKHPIENNLRVQKGWAMKEAVRRNWVDVMQVLYENGASLYPDQDAHDALVASHPDVEDGAVRERMRWGFRFREHRRQVAETADQKHNEGVPLILALQNESFEAVAFLVDHSVSIRNKCPICMLSVRRIYEDAVTGGLDTLVEVMERYRLNTRRWPEFDAWGNPLDWEEIESTLPSDQEKTDHDCSEDEPILDFDQEEVTYQ